MFAAWLVTSACLGFAPPSAKHGHAAVVTALSGYHGANPEVNTTTRFLNFTNGRQSNIINVSREMAWIEDTTRFVGATISLALGQCRTEASDKIDVTIDTTVTPGITKAVDSSVCTLRLMGAANASQYKIVVDDVYFETRHFHYPERVNYQFGWVFWTDHRMPINQYESMMFDPTMRIVYTARTRTASSRSSMTTSSSLALHPRH